MILQNESNVLYLIENPFDYSLHAINAFSASINIYTVNISSYNLHLFVLYDCSVIRNSMCTYKRYQVDVHHNKTITFALFIISTHSTTLV